MSLQLTLFAHAATAATRAAAFAADESLDETGLETVRRAADSIHRVDAAWSSPVRAARETAAALGLDARPEPALREVDYGDWAGLRSDEHGAVDGCARSDGRPARRRRQPCQHRPRGDRRRPRCATRGVVAHRCAATLWRQFQLRGKAWTLRWVGPIRSVG